MTRPGGVRYAAVALMALLLLLPVRALAADAKIPPVLERAQIGSRIEAVQVETYGVITPQLARRYLSLHAGSTLEQSGVNHDFANLVRLGGTLVRLTVHAGQERGSVDLHWIVMSKWLKPTTHPFYGDAPLNASIQGVGFILTGPPLNAQGANVSAYTQLSKRANLARALFTDPIHVDAVKGTESDVILDGFAGRGVYRASEPYAINVYSWALGEEALFLSHNSNGTQFETGFRYVRTTDQLPSSIVATSLFNTSVAPAHNATFVSAVSHACTVPAYEWRPPNCTIQYRISAIDGIGALGSTSRYRLVSADGVRYFAAGPSTITLHANVVRTGGVIPDSGLVCATVRGYPKSFCGTDAEGLTAEYRINEAARPKFQFVLFTEDAASRVRGAQAYALPYFTWHPDSGVGVIFHGFRLDLAGGQAGMRLTFELRGQLY